MNIVLSSVSCASFSSKEATYIATVLVGEETLSFEITVQHVQLGNMELVTVRIPGDFEISVNFNGPICEQLHQVIRDWHHNGATIPLPVLLGDTVKSVYKITRK
jgi:hypothetical protein